MKNQLMLLIAAIMISGAVLYGADTLTELLERQNEEVALLRLTVAQLDQRLNAIPESPTTRRMQASERQRSNETARQDVNISGAPQLGPDEALVTIVEFSDFECPYCRRVAPTMNQVREEYKDTVRVLFKHYPLSIHPNSINTHIAAEAAHLQGKFWEMHDQIFSNPADLSPQAYNRFAAEIGLDIEKFTGDMASSVVRSRVQQDIAEAKSLGVRGTPGFYINGQFVSGALPFDSFKQLIDRELATN